MAALRGGLRGVQQQIHQHLRELVGIDEDGRKVGRDAALEDPAVQHGLVVEEVYGVADQAIQVDLTEDNGVGAA